MNRQALFEKLIRVRGVCRVVSRDHTIDKIIISNPWTVANPAYVRASQIALALAVPFTAGGLLTTMTGLYLGIAMNIVLVAMLIRLAAPAASGFPRWNDFVVLGDSREFCDAGPEANGDPVADQYTTDPVGSGIGVEEALAAAYSVFATAHSSTRNAADTALKGAANYANAMIAITAAESLWATRKSHMGFFAVCTVLGMLCGVAIICTGGPEVERWIALIGPFSFIMGALLYVLNAPKRFRSRILPYRGEFLMHQNAAINGALNLKVLLGAIASGMVPFDAWFMMLIPGIVLGKAGETTGHRIVEALYPTPVPRLAHLVPALPFSLLSGLAVWNNFGGTVNWWTVLVCFLIPGILGLVSVLLQPVPDIVEHLGTDSNYLILSEPRLAKKAARQDSSDETLRCRSALQASASFDEMLDGIFSTTPEMKASR
jgi:hypothetical protein